MSSTFRCDDKDTLVAYLYDEIDAEPRRHVAAHLRTCAACASEVAAFQGVRQELASWQPPEPQLDVTFVQKPLDAAQGRPAALLRPARWFVPASMPAWAQVAAAVLVLAAGAAIANLHLRYGDDGLTITTGWMAPNPRPVADIAKPATEDWRPALASLESDLRRELQMVRASRPEAPVRVVAPQNVDSTALMRRVEAMVAQSEQRQRQELALRMTQFDRERRADLVRINQGFGQLQGRTGIVQENQREMMNLLRRVSTTQVP